MIFLYIIGILYIVYAILYIIMAYKVFKKHLPNNKNLPEDIKTKYFMFIRPEIDHINMCSMIFCGLTLGFFRFYMWVLSMVFLNIMLRIIWGCSDPNKPLGSCRKKLANIVTVISS